MQAHGNTTRVWFELTMILFGLPILGLITSAVLWAKAKHELDADRRQYLRLGFGAACFSFIVPLLVECLIKNPASSIARRLDFLLPLLPLAGLFASLVAIVVLAINARGLKRVAGPLLCLLALAYCGLTIFAGLAGGGGY